MANSSVPATGATVPPQPVRANSPPITSAAPGAGSLFRCWTPHVTPPRPGPKFRPVFVLRVEREEGKIFLVVAYGSGQHTSDKPTARKLMPWHVEFDPGEGGLGIDVQTRIDFSKTFRLPFTIEWFAKNGKTKSEGYIPASRKQEAQAAKDAGIAHQTTITVA